MKIIIAQWCKRLRSIPIIESFFFLFFFGGGGGGEGGVGVVYFYFFKKMFTSFLNCYYIVLFYIKSALYGVIPMSAALEFSVKSYSTFV